jgi:hypothetical protein
MYASRYCSKAWPLGANSDTSEPVSTLTSLLAVLDD